MIRKSAISHFLFCNGILQQIKFMSSFFVSQNRSLQSFFHEHCTTSEAVCFNVAVTKICATL